MICEELTLKRRHRVVLEDGPDPIDVFVGKRLREGRLQAGLSQSAVAVQLGVTFQAVQKYEAAGIRLSASTLYRLCKVLSVPPGYFFEGYEAAAPAKRKKRSSP